jgi:hypothetical protein
MTQKQIKELREDFNKHQSEEKGQYKKRDTWIKEHNKNNTRRVEQRWKTSEERIKQKSRK